MTSSRTGSMGLRLWFGLFGLGLALWFTVSYVDVILEISWILFGAMLLGLAIRPVVDYLQGWHVPRGLTVLLLYALLLGIVALVTSLLAPVVRQELDVLSADGPNLLRQSLDSLSRTGLTQWLPSTDTVATGLMQRTTPILAGAVGTLTGASRLVLDVLVLFILAYFSATGSGIQSETILGWFPGPQRRHLSVILAGIHYRLARWVWAQIAIAVFFAVVVTSGLLLLRVPFALTIGLTGAILEIVPYFGGIVALILALLSALTVNPWLAFWVLVFYVMVFAVESHVVAPIIYGHALGLRSAAVLLALFVGVKIAGVMGILFAVPVFVILTAVIQEIQPRRVSSDDQDSHAPDAEGNTSTSQATEIGA